MRSRSRREPSGSRRFNLTNWRKSSWSRKQQGPNSVREPTAWLPIVRGCRHLKSCTRQQNQSSRRKRLENSGGRKNWRQRSKMKLRLSLSWSTNRRTSNWKWSSLWTTFPSMTTVPWKKHKRLIPSDTQRQGNSKTNPATSPSRERVFNHLRQILMLVEGLDLMKCLLVSSMLVRASMSTCQLLQTQCWMKKTTCSWWARSQTQQAQLLGTSLRKISLTKMVKPKNSIRQQRLSKAQTVSLYMVFWMRWARLKL